MIVFAIWLAETPVVSCVFRHDSRTSRIALWWSLDSALNQLWFAGDGFALSRISVAKSIFFPLEVNPPVIVGDAAAGNLVIFVVGEDEALRIGWRCLAHSA